MSRLLKVLVAVVISLSLFGCSKDKETEEVDISYPDVETFDYSSMDTVKAYTVIEGIKYKYTFYFEDDSCINALVEISFDKDVIARAFYDNIKDNDIYTNVKIEGNNLSYMFNIEEFEYGMYSKKTLKEYIQRNGEFVIE